MVALQRQFRDILVGIKTVEDVQGARGDISAVFGRMVDLARNTDDTTYLRLHRDPEYRKFDREIKTQIQELGERKPDVMKALGPVLARNSKRLLEATSLKFRPKGPPHIDTGASAPNSTTPSAVDSGGGGR